MRRIRSWIAFVPTYRWVKAKTGAEVDSFYDVPSEMRARPKRRQGILESGIILRHMPNTGGRWDLGPYPSWVAAYLLAGGGSKTYRAMLHADGNGGGAFFVHVRQNGAPGYNVFTVEQPPLDRGYRIPLYMLPDGSRTPAQPDHAHAPSVGYVSYLLTGLSVAIEAGVPKAENAWKLMIELGGHTGEYGIQIVPRVGALR